MAEITISALAENIFKAKDIIAKEPTGFIQSVVVNGGSEGVSIGGTVLQIYAGHPEVDFEDQASAVRAADSGSCTYIEDAGIAPDGLSSLDALSLASMSRWMARS